LNRGGDVGPDGSNRLAFVLGASCALVAILVHSLTDFNMHIPANALLGVVWLAFLSTQLRFVSNRSWVMSPVIVRGMGPVILLGAAGYLLWQGQVGAREYRWLQRAGRAEAFSDAQVEAMERAFEIEPMNFNNAYKIGEIHRGRSWKGEGDYASHAETALEWFGRSMKLNPYDPYAPLRSGMCLDWLGRTDEAEYYYNCADERDPRGHYIAANIGWHYVHIGNYPAAQTWFERSKHLQWKDNELSDRYLEIIREQMLNSATNPLALPLLIE
jgi:tetratricopeptide (TPR) repeat protein